MYTEEFKSFHLYSEVLLVNLIFIDHRKLPKTTIQIGVNLKASMIFNHKKKENVLGHFFAILTWLVKFLFELEIYFGFTSLFLLIDVSVSNFILSLMRLFLVSKIFKWALMQKWDRVRTTLHVAQPNALEWGTDKKQIESLRASTMSCCHYKITSIYGTNSSHTSNVQPTWQKYNVKEISWLLPKMGFHPNKLAYPKFNTLI